MRTDDNEHRPAAHRADPPGGINHGSIGVNEMRKYTAADCDAAWNELRPHIQKLVDRFGQAQAFGIAMDVVATVCPDGMSMVPQYVRPGAAGARASN
jgi:hypothetical protein